MTSESQTCLKVCCLGVILGHNTFCYSFWSSLTTRSFFSYREGFGILWCFYLLFEIPVFIWVCYHFQNFINFWFETAVHQRRHVSSHQNSAELQATVQAKEPKWRDNPSPDGCPKFPSSHEGPEFRFLFDSCDGFWTPGLQHWNFLLVYYNTRRVFDVLHIWPSSVLRVFDALSLGLNFEKELSYSKSCAISFCFHFNCWLLWRHFLRAVLLSTFYKS